MNNKSAKSYLEEGCGRCELYQTPQCRVHLWSEPLRGLRVLLLASGMEEEMKWGSPCYTLGGQNVVLLMARKEYCALSFFQGVALEDPQQALVSPGPNSRFARLLRVTSLRELEQRRALIEGFLAQAMALARSGHKVQVEPANEPVPVELEERLAADPALRRAFEALTPGRRRSHILHIAQAKQAPTRHRRAEACIPRVLAGQGQHER